LICVAVAGVSGKTGSAVTRELMKREGVKVVGGVSRRWEHRCWLTLNAS